MSQSTMRPNLLQSLEIITDFRVDAVGQYLRVLAIDDVFLPVQEPGRDLELSRILDDCHESFEFVRVKISSTVFILFFFV
jgi:hypothetical protein